MEAVERLSKMMEAVERLSQGPTIRSLNTTGLHTMKLIYLIETIEARVACFFVFFIRPYSNYRAQTFRLITQERFGLAT